MFQSNFLRRVKADNPRLFWFFVTFIVLTLGTTALKIEFPPLYVYTMYSWPSKQKDVHTIYSIEYDGRVFNEPELWNHHRRIMFNYSISYYDKCIQADSSAVDALPFLSKMNAILGAEHSYIANVFTTKEDIRRYPQWLKHYMQSLIGQSIKRIKVYRIEAIYQEDGHVKEISKTLLCEA